MRLPRLLHLLARSVVAAVATSTLSISGASAQNVPGASAGEACLSLRVRQPVRGLSAFLAFHDGGHLEALATDTSGTKSRPFVIVPSSIST
jgi:hypothetical protein